MNVIQRGQPNTIDNINWYISVNCVLTDAYEVGFRVLDATGGEPGVQVFPAVDGTYETISGTDGAFGTGSYYAYDTTEETGWTPAVDANLGTYKIEWRWAITDGAAYQTGTEYFQVLEYSAGGAGVYYITVQDVLDAGLAGAGFSDEDILATIATWQPFIDRACRQWFDPKELTIKFDGTNSDTIHFGVPIISIEYLKLNNSDTSLEEDRYAVYNSLNLMPDDRKNPRIKLVSSFGRNGRDIYAYGGDCSSYRKFRKGRQNQEVKGIFGYVEADGSTPMLIKRALTKLVIEKITQPLYVGDPLEASAPPPQMTGPVIEEWTDKHKMKYGHAGGKTSNRAPGLVGITEDREIHDIILLYKAPLGIATPASWSYN